MISQAEQAKCYLFPPSVLPESGVPEKEIEYWKQEKSEINLLISCLWIYALQHMLNQTKPNKLFNLYTS